MSSPKAKPLIPMTIEQIQQEKQYIERQILGIVSLFTAETGVKVTGISINSTSVKNMGQASPTRIYTGIDVEITL